MMILMTGKVNDEYVGQQEGWIPGMCSGELLVPAIGKPTMQAAKIGVQIRLKINLIALL